MIADVGAYLVFFLVVALYYALLCLGLNLQWGVTGLFNVGVAGFVAVGAYASALLTGPDSPSTGAGWAWPVAVGWAGRPSWRGSRLSRGRRHAAPAPRLPRDRDLRDRGDDPAGRAELREADERAVRDRRHSPAAGGVGPGPRSAGTPSTSGWSCSWWPRRTSGSTAGAEPLGRVLRGLREDEAAAAALGKSPARYRLEAFVLGAMIMGLGGAIYAHFIGFVAPEDFLPILTFQVWTMLVVGGSGSNRGALVGGVLVWGLWSASGALVAALLPQAMQARGAALQVVLIGVVLAAVLLCRPLGLLGEEAVVSRHVRT